MNITEAIQSAVEGRDLSRQQAAEVMEQLMSGNATDAQIAALLTALRMKGETVEELTGFAGVMRSKAAVVRPRCSTGTDWLVDTCGTGGDACGTFNISTATAFVVAGAGVRVAKHGNRSVSSRCGSADVMEALGVQINLSPGQVAVCIDRVGIGFLFAPLLHEAMKFVMPARRQLKIRTVFNLLGPLTNPAGAQAQVLGVYARSLVEPMAQVLANLGSCRALVVHGADGLDEVTLTGPTWVSEVRSGRIENYQIDPTQLGFKTVPLEALRGGDGRANADIILGVLGGGQGSPTDVVLLNAAATLCVAGKAVDLRDGIAQAGDSIKSGKALEKLEQLIRVSHEIVEPSA